MHSFIILWLKQVCLSRLDTAGLITHLGLILEA